MPESSMHDFGPFPMSPQQIGTYFRVSTLQLVVCRFPDVVQQTTPSGKITIHSQHLSDQSRNESNLNTVPQHILAVRSSEVETPKHHDDTLMQSRDINLVGCFPSLLHHECVDLLAGFTNHLFNF